MDLNKLAKDVMLRAGALVGAPTPWFDCCRRDEHLSTIEDYLNHGFDPDARDTWGVSGLVHAGRGSYRGTTKQISNVLLDALEKRYTNDPHKLFSAVMSGNPRFDSDHADIADRIDRIKAHTSALLGDRDIWFESCSSDKKLSTVKEYLDHGFDPDKRDSRGRSGLFHAAKGSQTGPVKEVSSLLLDALEKKYANDPARLLTALTDHAPASKYHECRADIVQKLQARIEALQSSLGLPITASSTAVQSEPAASASLMTPHSHTLLPLKLDRTVTAGKLGQLNSAGETNLTAIANQGRLGEVFTPEIWLGRREEMEEAWKNVPEASRKQVNIEAVRGQLSQMTAREKFNVKDNSWGQGF